MSNLSIPFVSVIIPVFNDSARLKSCLQALEAQTYPQDSYEVIVIDNNSTEDISAIATEFKQVKFDFETKPGSYAARNKGIFVAKGDILAFTDSDCLPNFNWIEEGVRCLLSTDNCGLVGGTIKFYFKDRKNPTAAELYDSHNSLQQQNYIEEKKYAATANMFTFKHIVEKIGLFDSDLKSGGDREWGTRVSDAGYKLLYSEDAIVKHPARSFHNLASKVIRITEGHFILQKEFKIPIFSFLKELYLDFKPSIRFVIETISNKHIGSIYQRIIYIYVYSYLRFARAWKKAIMYWQYKFFVQKNEHSRKRI